MDIQIMPKKHATLAEALQIAVSTQGIGSLLANGGAWYVDPISVAIGSKPRLQWIPLPDLDRMQMHDTSVYPFRDHEVQSHG